MKVIRMSEIKETVNKRGFMVKTLVDHSSATVKNISLKLGDIIPNHSVPVMYSFMS